MDGGPTDAPAARHVPREAARLAARVRWLDRYRRRIAVPLALVLAPLAVRWLLEAARADDRRTPYVVIAPLIALIAWWLIEATMAWFAAVWETDYNRMLRGAGLPRAIVRAPRRRGPLASFRSRRQQGWGAGGAGRHAPWDRGGSQAHCK